MEPSERADENGEHREDEPEATSAHRGGDEIDLDPTAPGQRWSLAALPTFLGIERHPGWIDPVHAFVKVRDVIRAIESEGWRLVRQKGSHRQFKHPFRKGVVTIAGRGGAELPLGTLRSVFKQAGILR